MGEMLESLLGKNFCTKGAKPMNCSVARCAPGVEFSISLCLRDISLI